MFFVRFSSGLAFLLLVSFRLSYSLCLCLCLSLFPLFLVGSVISCLGDNKHSFAGVLEESPEIFCFPFILCSPGFSLSLRSCSSSLVFPPSNLSLFSFAFSVFLSIFILCLFLSCVFCLSFCLSFCLCSLRMWPFSGFYRARECPLFVPEIMRHVRPCLRKNWGLAGLLVMHRVGEGYWVAGWDVTHDLEQVWCILLLNRSSLGWGRRWSTVVLETTPFSTLQRLFSICPLEVLTVINWALIHGNLFF